MLRFVGPAAPNIIVRQIGRRRRNEPPSGREGTLMFRCWRGRPLCVLLLVVLACGSAAAQAPAPAEADRPDTIDELVAANRVLARLKILDAFGHVTIRHPANPQRYLMARSIAPAIVTVDDIVELDLESNPIDARGRAPSIERFIHGEIYKLRPDVKAIVHSHSPAVIPFSVSRISLACGAGLRPARGRWSEQPADLQPIDG